MSHTPTPWSEQGNNIIDNTNGLICTFEKGHWTFTNTKANKKRIVACVNACEPFTDPKIDIGLLKLDNEQKAKLLASCETALVERDTEITELKTRVTELEQGVKDAIAEMDRYYSLKLGVRILTDKTKPQQ